jgi:hypothetical protein
MRLRSVLSAKMSASERGCSERQVDTRITMLDRCPRHCFHLSVFMTEWLYIATAAVVASPISNKRLGLMPGKGPQSCDLFFRSGEFIPFWIDSAENPSLTCTDLRQGGARAAYP